MDGGDLSVHITTDKSELLIDSEDAVIALFIIKPPTSEGDVHSVHLRFVEAAIAPLRRLSPVSSKQFREAIERLTQEFLALCEPEVGI
jgi:hypothetical protein